MSQEKGICKIPHIHYVALSRVKRLKDLYILNMNEASMALDDDVNVEMHRLRTEAVLELCYVPLYKTDPGKIKIAFNNARSLHKHFRDVEFEPNVLAADAIEFAETRLCRRDENVHYALKRFRLIRLDDAEKESGNRPHHGLALYVKEYFQIQKVVKMQCKSFEFIFAGIYSIQRGYVQFVVLYKYPRSSQTDFRKDIHHHMRPVIDLNVRLVILGDFNIQIDCVNIKCKDEPVYAFLTGGAGVGKSVVIRALYQTLYRILNLKIGKIKMIKEFCFVLTWALLLLI